jgi:hypothetical protein
MRAAATLLLLALAGLSRAAAAQFSFTPGGTTLDSIATRFKIDFAVPEAPAFSLFQASKSSILRPGTVREFAALASDIVAGDGKLTVPEELGLEASPAMLIVGPRLSLQAYQNAPWLYRLRLSAAVKRQGAALTSLAFGLRTAVFDRADLRTNPGYLQAATGMAREINDIFAEQNREAPPAPGTELSLDDLTPERRARLDQVAERLKQRVEERAWNADILDVAAGALASARDSTGADLSLMQLAGWLTYAKGIGRWGQLLLGARASALRDSLTRDFSGGGSVGTRLYAGVNQYKVFLEAERRWTTGDNESLLGAGGEARLMHGGWIQFSTGLSWTGPGKPTLVGSATFKLGVLGL